MQSNQKIFAIVKPATGGEEIVNIVVFQNTWSESSVVSLVKSLYGSSYNAYDISARGYIPRGGSSTQYTKCFRIGDIYSENDPC